MRKSLFILLIVVLFSATIAVSGSVINPSLNHDQAVPMPLPQPKAPLGPPISENKVVTYDIATGVETNWTVSADDISEYAFTKGFRGDTPTNGSSGFDDEGIIDNYGSLTRVNNPEDYPYRVNCKIYMTFPNGWTYLASAVLIDDNHALTAGHCVYSQGDGGWATSIEVIPAYDNGSEPYGSAWATNLLSWSGWVYNEDFNDDMGVIRLNTNIGNSTGWYGYGYTSHDSWYQTYTSHNPGYPASYPYSGEYMYYWYGTFDDVDTYIVYFDREAYGGQSGSGATVVYNGNPYTVAVLSHGNYWWTGDTRMTGTKYGQIQDWINGNVSFELDNSPVFDRDALASIPKNSEVIRNYPNPFNARTNIEFTLSEDSKVVLSVYNIRGEKIDMLLNEDLNAGEHTVSWDASDYPSGVYFYKLTTPKRSLTKRMILIK